MTADAFISRRQQAEERREQILDAAARLFGEKGYSGASVREIARAVGVTEGLLYHYFPSKEQLMHATWKERSWRANLERILAASANKPLPAVLTELIRDFLQTLYANASMVRMCAAELQRNRELAEFYLARIEDNRRLMGDFLQGRQAAGEIRSDVDVNTPAGLLMGCAYSLFMLWGHLPADEWNQLADGLATQGVEVVMHGIAGQSDA